MRLCGQDMATLIEKMSMLKQLNMPLKVCFTMSAVKAACRCSEVNGQDVRITMNVARRCGCLTPNSFLWGNKTSWAEK